MLRDLTYVLAEEAAAERARVEHDGWGAENGRWEHAGQRYFDGEVEPCIASWNTLRALRVLTWWDGIA